MIDSLLRALNSSTHKPSILSMFTSVFTQDFKHFGWTGFGVLRFLENRIEVCSHVLCTLLSFLHVIDCSSNRKRRFRGKGVDRNHLKELGLSSFSHVVRFSSNFQSLPAPQHLESLNAIPFHILQAMLPSVGRAS